MMGLVLNIILLFGWSLAAWAQAESPGVPWSQLNQQEQQLLQKFNQDWDQLPLDRQERLRNGARQWSNMNPDERRTLRRQFRKNSGGDGSAPPSNQFPHRDRPFRPNR